MPLQSPFAFLLAATNIDVLLAVPPMHLPLFGMMAKALRREQAIFLLDQQGFEVNATDSVSTDQSATAVNILPARIQNSISFVWRLASAWQSLTVHFIDREAEFSNLHDFRHWCPQ